MSFILDAIKKADRKRREAQGTQLDALLEEGRATNARPIWPWLLGVALVLSGAFFGWLFASTQPAQELVGEKTERGERSAVITSARQALPEPDRSNALQVDTATVQQTLTGDGKQVSTTSRVYAINELPPDIRRRIPQLHMSLHAYSKEGASSGMVRVNGEILRQGGVLDDAFLLAEIRADGAVFDFQGYRFLLPRNQ